jgi:hypothetical protein
VNDRTQSPAEHHREAVRLVAVAESSGTDSTVAMVAALASMAHSLIASAPRRARRPEHAPSPLTGGPRARWARGDDE